MDTVQSRTYELTYLLPGDLTDSEVNQVKTEVEALLKKYNASDSKVEDWGRKPLAYVMAHEGKKHREAYYVHQTFQLPTTQTQALDRDMQLSPKVMRHLLLVSEEGSAEATEAPAA